ncbi:Bifunctional protein GlmU OS=Rhodanobacter lindaniclasticus OX=75310 GN=glmU PE=3 SV=1 [Rhodanobacter lindaniclasticus]
MADPLRVDVRSTVEAGRDVQLDIDVILEGRVVLGDNVRIGPFTRLKHVQLAAGTVLHPHCDLDSVVTHGSCTIGPFARLRPAPNWTLACTWATSSRPRRPPSAKAARPTISLISATPWSAAASTSAPAPSPELDGVNKFVTRIEDGAFMGSDSTLVAPATIAPGHHGAGSVITRDAPDRQLTVARGRQQSFEG